MVPFRVHSLHEPASQMPDLSFQEALNDPDLPFQQFIQACVQLWNVATEQYEQAGSPYGPADAGDNVSRWVLHQMEDMEHVQAAEELLGLDKCDD